MSIHQITLKHISYNNDQILYNGGTLNIFDLKVESEDILTFNALGSDWNVALLFVDGDYDHSSVHIKQNTTESILVNSAPKNGAIFEATCQACLTEFSDAKENGIYIPPIEAPKRIIVIRTGMTVDVLRTSIENKLNKINQLQIYLRELQERININ
jgi:hypothetical protein